MAERSSVRSPDEPQGLNGWGSSTALIAAWADEVFSTWRDCELVLDEGPLEGTVRSLLIAEAIELRRIHRQLKTVTVLETKATLERAWDTIYAARLTLAEAHRRLVREER